MKRQFLKLITSSALLAGLAFAQGPGMAPGHQKQALDSSDRIEKRIQMLTTVLDLTATQVTAATKIFTDAATATAAARTSLDGVRDQMQTAVKTNDLAAIDRLAQQIGQVHATIASIEAKSRAAFHLILTPAQIAKLEALGPRGPNGPKP